MKEILFIRNNIDKWRATESVVEKATNDSPDHLADVYTDLTADLAFAQAPLSQLTNHGLFEQPCLGLAQRDISEQAREVDKIDHFLVARSARCDVERTAVAPDFFLIFAVSDFVGVVSTIGDSDFPVLLWAMPIWT